MTDLIYINRKTGKEEVEKIYGKTALLLLYGDSLFSRFFALFFLPLISKVPFFSKFYGYLQKRSASKKKIRPFVETFHVDTEEFEKKIEDFTSFNDFFIRKLKPACRPAVQDDAIAVLPADGRYLVFPNVDKADGFVVKGEKFQLQSFLQSTEYANRYKEGSMVMARLCPTDYHRFHFPCDCIPSETKLINGDLYSVNPLALRKNIHIFSQNKRYITELATRRFGTILFIEVGATYVGSVDQTYIPDNSYRKGEEKGFFSFGGSCIVLLFEPGRIVFDQDLIEASENKREVKANYGESLGHQGS